MNQNQKSNVLLNVPKRNLFPFLFFFFSFFFFNSQSSFAQYQKTQKAVTANVHAQIGGFYESLPVDYASNPTKKYPVLIFLHGVGELGNGTTQLPLVLKNAIPKLLNAGTFPASFTVGGEKHSFIVISPQFKASSGQIEAIQAMIDYCIQHYRVDASRIYLTGLSLGGKRSWDFPASTKDRANMLAAITLVCSGASGTKSGIANITDARLPMWFLNNSGDPYISLPKAQDLLSSVNALISSPKAKITVFQQNGHDAWTKAYDPNFRESGLNVYEWMLSYKRGTSPQPAPPPPPPSIVLAANSGDNQVITLPTNSVTVDGSVKSTYPAGSTFLWTQKEGPATTTIAAHTSLKTSITGLNKAGDYRFQLKITDKNGNVSTSSVYITVNPAPGSTGTALKSNAGDYQVITLPTNSVTVDGSVKS
ncbi:hypothetical protein, partial [Agriterribacter sp.]|uniref:carboxylesterase family protein n=1 Tax=Agriterribacter sp. TaxID=2821509 RepID=UPI002CF63F3F